MGRDAKNAPLAAGQKAGILGLGVSGRATARFLASLGLEIAVSDQKSWNELERDDPNFLCFLRDCGADCQFGPRSGANLNFLDGLDLLCPAPGVPLQNKVVQEALRQGLPIMGELALAAGRFSVPVIAVTGSNGKTTVTGLIGHLLRAAGRDPFVGGNIGTPLLDYFARPDDYDCVVLELSSFQLEIAGPFRPDIGLLLNVTPDHLDRHGSLENYAKAKRHIFACQRGGDTAILGTDDEWAAATELPADVSRLGFSLAEDADAQVEEGGVRLRDEDGEHYFPLEATRLHSRVNRLNAAAAILAASSLGCEPEALARGLASFQPAAHRMAEVAKIAGVSYVDDSKATNIGAMAAALASCPGKAVLIAGGRDKGGDYALVEDIVRQKVSALVLIGEAAPLIEAAYGTFTPAKRAASMAEAVKMARDLARPGDTVLLAPACSSFDMFKSYGERGNIFAEAVLALKEA